jgi:predicted enzyme related to lactoylglutathione lyase
MIRSLYMVELAVADWPAAVAWYRDVLGLPLRMSSEADAFALFDVGGARISLKEGRSAVVSVALNFEVDDLAAELARLESQGVVISSPIKTSDEGYRRAFIVGPEGLRICLFEWVKTTHES